MSGHVCVVCRETEGFFHAFDSNRLRSEDCEICEICAEVYGCSCGCFPTQVEQVIAEIMGRELEKTDEGWRLI